MARKLLNRHLKNFDRRWLAFSLRDCYRRMKEYTSEACICTEKGMSEGLIDFGFITGVLSRKERDRYYKIFRNLYNIKRWGFDNE